MDNLNNEQKLINLGLSAKQIEMVLNRLSPENVQLFINEFNKEKSTLNRKNISISRNNIFQNQNNVYQPRIIPNFSEKISAKDMNKQYEEKSKFRNDPSENLEILSIQLFGDPNLYNDIYLDKKYRQLCLQFHPDRNNGDSSQFNMLKNCYTHLKQKLYNTNSINTNTQRPKNRILDNIVPPPDSLFENKFDNRVFNNYYDNNSFKTSSKGHGDWLKQNNSQIQNPKKPNEDNFNSAFESHKQQHYDVLNNNQLIKIQEIPDENQCTTDAFVLGEDESKTEDFSGKTKSGINYTDVRRALETPHLIYNDTDTSVKNTNVFKDYENMEQSHKNIPTQMSDREREIYDRKLFKKREAEENRMYTLRQNDEDIDNYFKKINTNRLTL